MKIVLIFGPQAVGKMTIGEKVGQALNIPLLHNHVTLDVIWPYIGWNEDTFKLSHDLRMGIFNHIAKDESHRGIVFTFVWAFNLKSDWEAVEEMKEIFNAQHHELYFVELAAELEERIKRNSSAYRLEKKPSKRDLEHSHNELVRSMDKHRLNSLDGEIKENHYMKLDVTHIDATEASQKIVEWINSRE